MQSVTAACQPHGARKGASPVPRTGDVFIHQRQPGRTTRRNVEAWLAGILRASQQWRNGAWAGRLVLEAPNDYIVAFRFKTYDLMRGWLNLALDLSGCQSSHSLVVQSKSAVTCRRVLSPSCQTSCAASRGAAFEDRRRARWRTGCNPQHTLGPPTEVEERPCDLALTPA